MLNGCEGVNKEVVQDMCLNHPCTAPLGHQMHLCYLQYVAMLLLKWFDDVCCF